MDLGLGLALALGAIGILLSGGNPSPELEDWLRHTFIIGQTGVGKSVFQRNKLHEYTQTKWKNKKCGGLYIDLHGVDAKELIDEFDEETAERVIYINPSNIGKVIGFNIIEATRDEVKRQLRSSQLIETFDTVWSGSIGASTSDILRMASLGVLEQGVSSILEVYMMLANKEYRENIEIKNPVVKNYWEETYPTVERNPVVTNPPLNKLRTIVGNSITRYTLCQARPKLDLLKAMNQGKIIICDFESGKIGEKTAQLLACIVVAKIQQAAFQRAKGSIPFFIIIDECHKVVNPTFSTILSEARKFGLSLTLADQFTHQLPDYLVHSILGNCGNIYSFRVGDIDSRLLHKYLSPCTYNNLVDLDNYYYYRKGIIRGKKMKEAVREKAPKPPKKYNLGQYIIENSLNKYGISSREIEKDISRRMEITTTIENSRTIDFENVKNRHIVNEKVIYSNKVKL